jgi:hypothetical protein
MNKKKFDDEMLSRATQKKKAQDYIEEREDTEEVVEEV